MFEKCIVFDNNTGGTKNKWTNNFILNLFILKIKNKYRPKETNKPIMYIYIYLYKIFIGGLVLL